jgi:hypothetical protein
MIYTIPNVYAHNPPQQQSAKNNQQTLSGQQTPSGQTLSGQTPDQSKFATVMVVSLIGMGLFKLWSMGREKAED